MYHQLKEGSGNILGLKIVGGITKKQKERICKVLEKQISESGKIRLVLVIEPHKKMDAESLLFDLNFTLHNYRYSPSTQPSSSQFNIFRMYGNHRSSKSVRPSKHRPF